MNIILSLLIIITLSFLITRFSKKLRIPPVVSLIGVGLIFGIPLLHNYILGDYSNEIFILGDIALLFLMFFAGFETSWSNLKRERKDSFLIAVLSFVVPFILGFFAIYLLGFSVSSALVVAISMSITAEATRAKVLHDLKKTKSRVGSAMMGAGIIDDLIGLILFVLIMISFLHDIYLREIIVVGLAIVSFFIGILVKKNLGKDNPNMVFFEKMMYVLLIPFFFVAMGMHFDFGSIIISPLTLLVVLLVGFFGKVIGVSLLKFFSNFSNQQLHLIAWGMNSRGAIGLAIALIALRNGLISPELYSGLVVLAFFTTVLFPFVITNMVKNNRKIMN